ncbi:MAG: hypothetical protein K2G74_01620 [Muribaculaceae bacterium]|nr:hypothetical protein [Muribaculaceae bacterium]
MKKNYLVILIGLALASCGDIIVSVNEDLIIDEEKKEVEEDEIFRHDIELSDIESNIVDTQTEFACNFFRASLSNNKGDNFVISPLSAYMDLSMVANGASGKTASEITSILMGDNSTIEEVNTFNKRLATELSAMDNRAKLKLSNSIWYNSDIQVKPSFLNVNKEYYDALSTSLDFTKRESFDVMDKWVDDATNGLIKSFPTRTPFQFAIVNALYFNGKWAYPFDPDDTKDDKFINGDGSVSVVKMMEKYGCEYYEPSQENGKFVVVQIPYGNWSYTFNVAFSISDDDLSLDGIENVIVPENIKRMNDSMRSGGTIKLPRFEVSTTGGITYAMENLGIKELFNGNPDLSGITNSKIGQLSILQESVIKVDESGAKAGSATAMIPIGGLLDGPTPDAPKSFIVNSPFVFFIMEQSTNTILFMGKVDKLENAKE